MGKLLAYNFVSANGFFKGPNDDISWAYRNTSEEESEFASENAQGGAVLLFGRKTYEMMANYWPTPQAMKNNAGVAEGMNKAEKIVFSKTLKNATWKNTRIVHHGIEEEVKKLKESGRDITILGSGTIVDQLANLGLIDEFQIMIHPVAIGSGTALMTNIQRNIDLELVKTRTFKTGAILLCYRAK